MPPLLSWRNGGSGILKETCSAQDQLVLLFKAKIWLQSSCHQARHQVHYSDFLSPLLFSPVFFLQLPLVIFNESSFSQFGIYWFRFGGVSQNTEKYRILPFCTEFSTQKINLYLNFHSCGKAWPKLGSVPQIMLEKAGSALFSLQWGHIPGFWSSSHCGWTLPDFKDVATGHSCSWAGLDLLHMKSTIKWGEKMLHPEQDVVQSPDFLRHCESCCPLHKALPKPGILCAYTSETTIKSTVFLFPATQRWTSKTHMEKAGSKSQLIVHKPESTSQKSIAAMSVVHLWLQRSLSPTEKAKLLINCFST